MGRGALSVVTALGPMRIEYTDRGVCGLHLGRAGNSTGTPPVFVRRLSVALKRYARGAAVVFDAPLDLPGGTDFQRQVWRTLRRIPRGQTRSYAWVARQAGRPKAVRAAGGACGANPVPVLIPCHRVVGSDGRLGGFSAGLAWKRRLLRLENSLPAASRRAINPAR